MNCVNISLFFMLQDVHTALNSLDSLSHNLRRRLNSQNPDLKPTNQKSPIFSFLSGLVFVSICVQDVRVPELLFHKFLQPFLTWLIQSQQRIKRNCQHFLNFRVDRLMNFLLLVRQTKQQTQGQDILSR